MKFREIKRIVNICGKDLDVKVVECRDGGNDIPAEGIYIKDASAYYLKGVASVDGVEVAHCDVYRNSMDRVCMAKNYSNWELTQ